MRWLLSSVLLGSVIVACSGAGDNPLGGPGGGGGGGNQDGGGGGGGDGGGSADSGLGPCDAKCNLNVPNGFKLITTGDRMNACPQGWTQKDVVAEPKAMDGACSCACNVSQKPTCNTGSVNRYTDQTQNPACNTNATTIALTGQNCSVLPNYIYASGLHYAAVLPPTGGACSWDAKPDPQKLVARDARTCEVPSNCQGAVCGAKSVCVITDGDLACPMTFPQKTLVGASAALECGQCGACKLEASCTGTLSLYTDYQCLTGKTDYPVDGTCNKNPGQNYSFYAFSFTGSVGKSDCAGPAPTAGGTAKLADTQTICCTQ